MVDDTTVGTRNPAPKRDVWKPLQSYGINHRPQVVTAGFLKHQQFLRHFQGWLCWICWSRHLLVSFPTRWCGDVSFKLKKNQQQSCPLERATTYNSVFPGFSSFFCWQKKSLRMCWTILSGHLIPRWVWVALQLCNIGNAPLTSLFFPGWSSLGALRIY